MGDNSKIIFAALGGAAVGAATALLLAPASGKETREKISDKFNETKNKLADKGQDVLEKMKSDV